LRYSVRSALTIAVALAQIGEFSFLLADEAKRDRLLPADGHSLLVACAIISITLNPLLFRAIEPVEQWLRRRPALWRLLVSRSEAGGADLNLTTQAGLGAVGDELPLVRAVIVGYGPVGQTARQVLNDFGVQTVVVDLNLDTVRQLAARGGLAIYGDATQRDILNAAGIREAKYLLVTVPEVLARTVVILAAKELNADLRVFARARYIQERAWLAEVGATAVIAEEAETALALAALLLREVEASPERIRRESDRIQRELYTPDAPAGTNNDTVNSEPRLTASDNDASPPLSQTRPEPASGNE
jgi:CPA2 family monovalent cation:H+ antiporter-2